MAGVSQCERKHIVDDARQPSRLLVNHFQRLAIFCLIATFAFECNSGRGPNYGKRRSQLMGGISHEAPFLSKRLIQPGEQLIESGGKSAQLVSGVGYRKSLYQILGADLSRTLHHFNDRRETSTSEKPSAKS